MATAFKRLHDTAGALSITLASLANVAGRVSAQVDLTDVNGLAPDLVRFFFRIRTGSVAPNAGKTVEAYLVNGDEDGTTPHLDGGFGTTDSGTIPTGFTAANIRDQLQPIASQPVIATTALDFYFTGVIYEPPPRFSVYVYNDTGQALDAAGTNFWVRYRAVYTDGR